MNILDIITMKKNGEVLTFEELDYAFNGYLTKKIPDYQMSALLMAIVINGMELEETVNLTKLFIASGDTYDLSYMDKTVDKHSTGGIGDSTTLIVGPLCAALGLHMAKMSGRGLGLTGGTIDKLESIPGFNVNLTKEEFLKQVELVGFANTSQTGELCPMDKEIYRLRDVTGTTESIPLIASSIMSKKIAAGAQNILIDVKYGSGALTKNIDDAKKLSDWLIKIGTSYGRNVKTVLSEMNTPLSQAVGNAVEVKEAINVLKGKRCRLLDSCIEIASMLYSMACDCDIREAEKLCYKAIDDGSAYKKFLEFVEAQGGRIDDLKLANNIVKVKNDFNGKVFSIDALGAAKLAAKLGASKMNLDDQIDYTVGLFINVNVGDVVDTNTVLVTIYMGKNKIQLKNDDFKFINIV